MNIGTLNVTLALFTHFTQRLGQTVPVRLDALISVSQIKLWGRRMNGCPESLGKLGTGPEKASGILTSTLVAATAAHALF